VPDANANEPLYNRDHPDHVAAVQQHLDSFREPSERAAPVSAPAPAPADALDADGIPRYDPKAAYWNKEHPEHTAAVAAVQATMRAKHNAPVPPVPDPATGAGADAANKAAQQIAGEANVTERDAYDLADVRERAGVSKVQLAAPFQKNWSEDAEADVLEHLATERVPGRVIEAMREEYVKAALHEGLTEETFARFRDKFAPHVPEKTLAKLVTWVKAWHGIK